MNTTTPMAALAAFLLCGACSFLSPEPDPTRFAVLAASDELPGAQPSAPATAQTFTPAAPQAGLAVGLGPIVVPEYLLCPEIQTRTGGTRLVPSLTERWGEPLDRGLERVLSLDLKAALGAERIVLHPWFETDAPDVQVRVAFSRFERTDGGNVVLRATWSLSRPGSDAPPIERETHLERPAGGADGAGAALELSRMLAELARAVATAWPELPPEELP